MILTQEEALVRISERVAENKKRIDRSLKQRRNQVVDMYGVEYTRQGAENAPARFYISISPDMVYLERFEFKLIVQPFLSMAGGISPTELTVSGGGGGGGGGGGYDVVTSSDIQSIINSSGCSYPDDTGSESYDVVTSQDIQNILNSDGCSSYPDDTPGSGGGGGGSSEDVTITPNPHTHTMTTGITPVTTTANDFRVKVEGIDITPYLMAQYGGNWIDGEGVYPSLNIGEDYDILEVASDLVGEGRTADADKLVRSGYKAIEISASGTFSVTLVNYLKYSHLNR